MLTADQIAKLVAQLQEQTASPTDRPSPPADRQKPDASAQVEPNGPTKADAVATKLSLTAEQKAAYQAFVTAQEANRPVRDEAAHQAQHEAQRQAMITFWETGDTAALEAAKPAQLEKPAFPVDELVALATSLNAEQRQQLFARGFGPGGQRGPGGHEGGKGGKRGGHGGPGGFAPQAPADATV